MRISFDVNNPASDFFTKSSSIEASAGTGKTYTICEKVIERIKAGYDIKEFWDRENKELFMARDPFGIKPLHYAKIGENFIYGSEIKTMMPKLHSDNFEGLELIRPLYLVKEEDIIKWRDYNHLEFIRCACRFTENIEEFDNNESNSKRYEMKRLIDNLRKINPKVDMNIYKSTFNVNLNTIISYKKDDKEIHFLDNYEIDRIKKEENRKKK